MKLLHAAGLVTLLAATAMFAAAPQPANAQERERGTVVVFPLIFSHNGGDETSRNTGRMAVNETLQKGGYTLIPAGLGESAWKHLGYAMPTADDPAKRTDLARLGTELKARYVVSAVINFHTRSIWVDLGPRTVSSATVDIVITDAADDKTVYTRTDIVGRSDEKFDLAKAGADLLISPLVTIVSGGPKTPHEQRAVQIAVAKAMRDWARPEDGYDHHNDVGDNR
jgi:hypothetical protein